MFTSFFTFGSDHHDGEIPLRDRFVSVSAPDGCDNRAIFMAWRGSNAFSAEYNAYEFEDYREKYSPRLHVRITVEEIV